LIISRSLIVVATPLIAKMSMRTMLAGRELSTSRWAR
jgi:hypothetical protein